MVHIEKRGRLMDADELNKYLEESASKLMLIFENPAYPAEKYHYYFDKPETIESVLEEITKPKKKSKKEK